MDYVLISDWTNEMRENQTAMDYVLISDWTNEMREKNKFKLLAQMIGDN